MKTNVRERRLEPTENDIQKAAYFLWLERGRPQGCDQEVWFAAKEMLIHGPSTSVPVQPRIARRATQRVLRTEIKTPNSRF